MKKNVFRKLDEDTFIQLINQKNKSLSKYILKLAFFVLSLIILLIQPSILKNTFAQTQPSKSLEIKPDNLKHDPFSWEIKPSDINPEFLRGLDYNLNVPSSQSQENSTQQQVRFIYFVPSDKIIRDDYKVALTDAALYIQDFYQKELGNGFTFSLHSPVVEVYQTSHASSWYASNRASAGDDDSQWFYYNLLNDGSQFTGANFNDPNNRWIYFLDADAHCNQASVGGVQGIAIHDATVLHGLTKQAGLDPCPDGQPEVGRHYRTIGGIAHEMGHSFLLPHPQGCNTGNEEATRSLMCVGYFYYPNTYFLTSDKQFLLNDERVRDFFSSLDLRPPQFSDFENDRKADFSIWRPSSGVWSILPSSGGNQNHIQWGANGDKIVPGDYDGDGKTDVAVWRPSGGYWYILRSANNTFYGQQFGSDNDIPVAADYDGDRLTDIAVWQPSTANWYIYKSATNIFQSFQFGASGDKPVQADYNGDKRADFAVWRPSNGTWYIYNYYMSSSSTPIVSGTQYGANDDKLVPSDYDGDKKADIAVWRPSNGIWYYIGTSSGTSYATQLGAVDDIPTPADFDNDGKIDFAVWRPDNGVFYVLRSSNGSLQSAQWGLNGDIPVASAFVR